MKKKILIVDDTPANLDAAKTYFANNTDFEFVYASNRKEAEELLPSCDGLITDGQMPFDENTSYVHDMQLKLNGILLFLEAREANKTAVFVSSHGEMLTIFKSFGTKDNEGILKHKLFAEKNGFSLKEILDEFSGKDFTEEFLSGNDEKREFMQSFIYWSLDEVVGQYVKDVNKENSVGWELAFEGFPEEFKLNERPTEVPKIKLQ